MAKIKADVLREKFMIALFSILTFIVGISVRGDWVLIVKAALTQYPNTDVLGSDNGTSSTSPEIAVSRMFKSVNIGHVLWHQLIAMVMSFGGFFLFGGALNHFYYTKRRHQAVEWKCQPERFLSPENERHAFKLGTINMVMASVLSGFASACLYENGPSKLYFTISERGWIYFVASIPIYFLAVDGAIFYAHRFFHSKYFYRRFHSWHHRYHQPVVWTSLAMHPVELLIVQAILILPMFIVRVHVVVFVGNLMYCYYYGMVDHSGIKMEALWPWQPPSTFHDSHHVNPNCNMGFNTTIFDRFHGTFYRRTEDIRRRENSSTKKKKS